MSGSGQAAELIHRLDLQAHPEGGHYREVFRSERSVRRDGAERAAFTTIYYLLQAGDHSRWHVVNSDEAWHFYQGEGLELLHYQPETGQLERLLLGPVSEDAAPVHVIPAGAWQAARPLGAYTLAGCSVGPGFEFDDFRLVADLAGHEDAFLEVLQPYRLLL
jgi:predicted cupin superfamily sugar epimerase